MPIITKTQKNLEIVKIQGLTQGQITKILKCIHLHGSHIKIFAFGSRVKGTARKYSDLDLALDAGSSLDLSVLVKIKNTISETDLPIVIDIVDYCSLSADFKALVDAQKRELYFTAHE